MTGCEQKHWVLCGWEAGDRRRESHECEYQARVCLNVPHCEILPEAAAPWGQVRDKDLRVIGNRPLFYI